VWPFDFTQCPAVITTLRFALLTAVPEHEAVRVRPPSWMVKNTRPAVVAIAPVPGQTAAAVVRDELPSAFSPAVGGTTVGAPFDAPAEPGEPAEPPPGRDAPGRPEPEPGDPGRPEPEPEDPGRPGRAGERRRPWRICSIGTAERSRDR